jgi:hypothetical protein
MKKCFDCGKNMILKKVRLAVRIDVLESDDGYVTTTAGLDDLPEDRWICPWCTNPLLGQEGALINSRLPPRYKMK